MNMAMAALLRILNTVHSDRCPREVNKECWFAVYAFDRVENPHRQVHSRSMGRCAGVSKLRRQTQGVLQFGFPHHRSIARDHRSEYPQAKDVLRKQEMGSKLKSRPFGTQTLGLPCSGRDALGWKHDADGQRHSGVPHQNRAPLLTSAWKRFGTLLGSCFPLPRYDDLGPQAEENAGQVG